MKRHLAIHLTALAAVCLTAAPARAHHSYATFFDLCASKTIEGTVERVEWKEPHVWVFLATEAGNTLRAEWTNPQALARDAVSSDTLKAGDRVAITGSPFRDPAVIRLTVPAFKGEFLDTTMSALTQVRRQSDGWSWGRPAQPPPNCAAK
jgi:hypothetical protein